MMIVLLCLLVVVNGYIKTSYTSTHEHGRALQIQGLDENLFHNGKLIIPPGEQIQILFTTTLKERTDESPLTITKTRPKHTFTYKTAEANSLGEITHYTFDEEQLGPATISKEKLERYIKQKWVTYKSKVLQPQSSIEFSVKPKLLEISGLQEVPYTPGGHLYLHKGVEQIHIAGHGGPLIYFEAQKHSTNPMFKYLRPTHEEAPFYPIDKLRLEKYITEGKVSVFVGTAQFTIYPFELHGAKTEAVPETHAVPHAAPRERAAAVHKITPAVQQWVDKYVTEFWDELSKPQKTCLFKKIEARQKEHRSARLSGALLTAATRITNRQSIDRQFEEIWEHVKSRIKEANPGIPICNIPLSFRTTPEGKLVMEYMNREITHLFETFPDEEDQQYIRTLLDALEHSDAHIDYLNNYGISSKYSGPEISGIDNNNFRLTPEYYGNYFIGSILLFGMVMCGVCLIFVWMVGIGCGVVATNIYRNKTLAIDCCGHDYRSDNNQHIV